MSNHNDTPLIENKKLKDKSDVEPAEKQTLQKRMIKTINSLKVESFADQLGDAHITLKVSGKKRTAKIMSNEFKSILYKLAYQTFGATLKKDSLEEIRQALNAEALYGLDRKIKPLFTRVAKRDGAIFYDLGGPVVRVSRDGWEVQEEAEGIFKHDSQCSLPQVLPERGDALDSFFESLNIKNKQDLLLLKVFLVSSFIPEIPHPILVIYGQKGAAKSTLLRRLLAIIDPTPVIDADMSKKDDFLLLASKRWAIGLDNISKIVLWQSDMFCKLSTGGSFQKRALYTNDELVIYELRNVLIMNGIPCVAEKSDLLDRAILIELQAISDDLRQEEVCLDQKFLADLPKILGGVFDVLAKTIAIHPKLVLAKRHRLADFHRWAVAIGEAMGVPQAEVDEALNNNHNRQHEAALDASWLAQLVISYLTERAVFIGTASGLKNELCGFVESSNQAFEREIYRIQPNWLVNELKRLQSVLQSQGIDFERLPRGKDRQLRLEMSSDHRNKLRKSKLTDGAVKAVESFDSFTQTRVQESVRYDDRVDFVDNLEDSNDDFKL